MPDILRFLENDRDLLPLLRRYIGLVKPDVILEEHHFDESDYEYLESPEFSDYVVGYRPDVLCNGNSPAQNIATGYWNAIARSLKAGKSAEDLSQINMVSLISHNHDQSNAHWTSSVSELSIDSDCYEALKKAFDEKYDTPEAIANLSTNAIKNFINETQLVPFDVQHDPKLWGVNYVAINHYDSHTPGDKEGRYFKQYAEAVGLLEVIPPDPEEEVEIDLYSGICATQEGNTCGDYALYNGFMTGVLLKDLEEAIYHKSSQALRAFTEQTLNRTLDEADVERAMEISQHLEKSVNERLMVTPGWRAPSASLIFSQSNEESTEKMAPSNIVLTFQAPEAQPLTISESEASSDSIDLDVAEVHEGIRFDEVLASLEECDTVEQIIRSEEMDAAEFELLVDDQRSVNAQVKAENGQFIFTLPEQDAAAFEALAETVMLAALKLQKNHEGKVPDFKVNGTGQQAQALYAATLKVYQQYQSQFSPPIQLSAPGLNEAEKHAVHAYFEQQQKRTSHKPRSS